MDVESERLPRARHGKQCQASRIETDEQRHADLLPKMLKEENTATAAAPAPSTANTKVPIKSSASNNVPELYFMKYRNRN